MFDPQKPHTFCELGNTLTITNTFIFLRFFCIFFSFGGGEWMASKEGEVTMGRMDERGEEN